MVCFISLLGYIGGSVYIAALPELSQVFQTSSIIIKFSITIYFIGFLLGTILSGLLAELLGRIWTLTFFLLLSIVASLLCGFSPTISWFLGGRLLEGIGYAGGPVLAMALIADHYKGAPYHKFMDLILIIIGLGPGIAPIFGSLLLQFFEWRVIFYVLAALEALALGLTFFVKLDVSDVRRKVGEALQEYGFFLKHPYFRYHFLMVGILFGAFYAFIVISPYIFRLHYGWSIFDFVWVGLAVAFANSFGSFLDRELNVKMGSRKVFLIGLTLIALSLLILFFIGYPKDGVWLLLTVSLFVVGDNLISSSLIADAVKMGPQFTSISSSLINLSRVLMTCLILLLIPVLPEQLIVSNFFFLTAFVICVLGYFKIWRTF